MQSKYKLYEVVYKPFKGDVFIVKVKAKNFDHANIIALESQPLLSIDYINEITN